MQGDSVAEIVTHFKMEYFTKYEVQWNLNSLFSLRVWKKNNGYGKTMQEPTQN
jgi:hypothetical protein